MADPQQFSLEPYWHQRLPEIDRWIKTFQARDGLLYSNDGKSCVVSLSKNIRGGIGAPGANGSSPTWFEITSNNSAISPNRWQYGGAARVPDRNGLWKPSLNGPASIYLYNTLEVNNASGGVAGSGDNLTTLPGGAALLPIGVGAVVPAWPVINCDGILEYHFAVANNVGGDCMTSP